MRDRGYIREYRALLIGEQRFLREDGEGFYTELANRNKNDVNQLMKPALGRTIGPSGVYGANEGHFIITTKINLAYGQIKTAIQTAFRDTRDQDISVFFIATHGNSAGDGELEMAFTGDPNKPDQVRVFSENQLLPMSTLAGWLREYVRGKVFVILESCGAGSAIYPADNGSKALKASKTNRGTSADDEYDPKAFVSEAVAVFSKADPGLTEPDGTEEGLRKDSTGDMKVGKFYVLAAAAHHEMSYGWEAGDASFNFFTKWLTDGIGRKGSSPADRNGDEKLTLQELYSYIKNVGDDYISSHFEGNPDQHVQCWPANSSVALLRLK